MKTTICLNMIVRNESSVIQRCLESVKGIIDYWVIVDTGSNDGTQAIIRDFMKAIPGELYERPWVNFGRNRNEALALARGKADYILFIDADDRLVFSDSFSMPMLDKDAYYIMQYVKNRDNAVTEGDKREIVLMVRDLPVFYWEGIMHEGVACYEAKSKELLTGVIYEYLHDGGRTQDPDRFKKDADMLIRALQDDPGNHQLVFYLAQAYACDNNLEEAIRWFEKRVAMGGSNSDIYYSHFYSAVFQRSLKMAPETYLLSFSKAYLSRPSRAEPLYDLTGYFIQTENYFLGYLIAELALSLPKPSSYEPLLQPWIYEWGTLWAYSICARRLGKKKKSDAAMQKLLACPSLPEEMRKQIQGARA